MVDNLKDICVYDYHMGYYIDLVSSFNGTWTLYYGKSNDRQKVENLSYEKGKELVKSTLFASRVIAEIIFEDDIKYPRMFE